MEAHIMIGFRMGEALNFKKHFARGIGPLFRIKIPQFAFEHELRD